MQNEKKILIFSDFDGTISLENISMKMFGRFVETEPFVTKLMNGDLSIYDFWHQLCGHLPKVLTLDELKLWASEQEIDPYFEDFATWCRKEKIKLKISSDGFDNNIDGLLGKYNLGYIEKYCNSLFKLENGDFSVAFEHSTESCSCPSAVCKRNTLINNSEENGILVFVGDGISDFCVARHSDIVFAKGLLVRYCNENKIPHYPYKSFFDVKRILSDLIMKNKLRQRNIARVNRNHAIAGE